MLYNAFAVFYDSKESNILNTKTKGGKYLKYCVWIKMSSLNPKFDLNCKKNCFNKSCSSLLNIIQLLNKFLQYICYSKTVKLRISQNL